MSFRRVGGIATTALATLLGISCGQVYRPVVLPVATPPPNPANFRAVFGLATNVAANPGTAMQIDVSGDSTIGVADMGLNPTHAATVPNNSRVFVSSAAGSLCPTAGPDTVTAFTPAVDSTIATGLGIPTVITYPNAGTSQMVNITSISELGNLVNVTLSAGLVNAGAPQSVIISNVSIAGYNGCFPINTISGTQLTYVNSVTGLASITSGQIGTVELPAFCPYLPDYVATTQNSAVFVANYGAENNPNCGLPSTDSVASITTSQNAITNIVYLGANTHPVAMAETQDGLNLYVVNQASNDVVDLSPTDLSILTPTPISVGTTPVWVVARNDSRRIYVLTQGSGQLVPIDTASNQILLSTTNLSVGAGANFVLYDPNLGRLYVTNPATSTVYVFSTTGGNDPTTNPPVPNDTPTLLKTISFAAGSAACPNGCSPVSIAAMPDGSRFYVASYQLAPTCPDPNVGSSSPCIVPLLTVFNAPSMTVKPVSSAYTLLPPSLSLLTPPQFGATQYAVAQIPSCAPATPYTPSPTQPGTTPSARFRIFTTAASDSSHVYVSICDAGIVADINATTSSIATSGSNTPDTLAANILAPLAACAGPTCGAAASITGFSIANNVVTFQAVNNYIVGEQVSISGLSTPVGLNLNSQILTVLSTGLSGTQFEAVLNPPNTQPNTPLTKDSGTAVPVPALQNPIFLLTGQ